MQNDFFIHCIHHFYFEVFPMDERRHNRTDPWEPGMYETGRTRPPKSHGGLIALLLVIVIFLGGLVSVLGILNVRLFAKLQNLPEDERDALSFISTTEETAPPEPIQTEPTIAHTQPPADTDVFLNPSPDSMPNIPQEGGLSLQEIYTRNIDSVVSITCSYPGGSRTGTGVILSESGYIVTNCHVVEDASFISVLLTDDRSFTATLIGADAVSDLAVLHVEASGLKSAQFGDSSALQVGDSVAAIGDPLGSELRGTMTNGIVSAINRDMTIGGRTLTLIQTNAALNSGNSGGPLINCYGQVIGINTMKIGDYVNSAGVEGLGFAIPSTTVKQIVDQLIAQGYVSGRPDLGINGTALSSFYQYYYRLPAGVYINEVDEGSDAQMKGILPKDILLSVAGQRVTSMEDVQTVLYAHEAGETVEVIIYRNGQQYRVDLTLAESTS